MTHDNNLNNNVAESNQEDSQPQSNDNIKGNEDLDTQIRQEKITLLKSVEGKYASQPFITDMVIFSVILILEFLSAFNLVYQESEDGIKALTAGILPVVITVAAASYQANTYEVEKEKEKLQESYDEIIKEYGGKEALNPETITSESNQEISEEE